MPCRSWCAIALGTGEVASIAIITILTLIYTFEGGLAAVIWTDVVQTVIYVGGTLVGLWTILHLVPGDGAAIHAAAASAGKLQVFDFTPSFWIPYTFWAGVIGGTFFITASHGTDQLIVQRLLAARSQKAIGDGVAFERRRDSVSVCVVPDCGCHAVGVLSRALGEFRQAGPNLSHVHRQPHAAWDFRAADRRDSGGGDVELERGAELPCRPASIMDFYVRFRPQADEQRRMRLLAAGHILLGDGAVWPRSFVACTKLDA
jgi:hypothetical protein